MKNGRFAFTLVEVLVSISIVCILFAIVLSSYVSAIKSAKTTVCISNLRQLATGMLLYNEDYGSFPPMSERWPGLQKYVGRDALKCPVRDTVQRSIREDIRVSYFVHAFFEDKLDPVHRADEQCMAERGSAYSIAHDSNHRHPIAASAVGSAFYLFVHLDGSVSRKPAKEVELFLLRPDLYPCPKASYYSNF